MRNNLQQHKHAEQYGAGRCAAPRCCGAARHTRSHALAQTCSSGSSPNVSASRPQRGSLPEEPGRQAGRWAGPPAQPHAPPQPSRCSTHTFHKAAAPGGPGSPCLTALCGHEGLQEGGGPREWSFKRQAPAAASGVQAGAGTCAPARLFPRTPTSPRLLRTKAVGEGLVRPALARAAVVVGAHLVANLQRTAESGDEQPVSPSFPTLTCHKSTSRQHKKRPFQIE